MGPGFRRDDSCGAGPGHHRLFNPAPKRYNRAMTGHVFISYASEEMDAAYELCAFIEAKGVKAWIAPRDVRPGIDYSEALQAALEGCAAFVVLVTEEANRSPYVRVETEMAFSNSKPMLPVRFSDIQPAPGLAFFLKIRHWTDAYGRHRDANLARLALELQTLTGKAPSWAPKAGPAAPPPLAEAPPPAPPPTPAPPPAPPPAAPASPAPQPADAAPPAVKPARSILPWAIVGGIALVVIAVAVILLTRRPPVTLSPGPPGNGSMPAPTPQDRAYGGELVDFGVQPKAELESNVGSPTPLAVPVGARATTAEVQRALTDGTNPILVDVLAGGHSLTLPNAVYMPAGGMPGSFQDQWQTVFTQQLSQVTGGNTTRPLVFFCQGASCWESYNALLRANAAGYTNIYWYRGGLVAWTEAGYATSPLPGPYGGLSTVPEGY
jgi:PQQ-dependent catabolism-associated CXXCW motif protein